MDGFAHVAVREVTLDADLALTEVEVSTETDSELIEWLKVAAKLPGKAPVVASSRCPRLNGQYCGTAPDGIDRLY